MDNFNKDNIVRTAVTAATGLGIDALSTAGNLAGHAGSFGVIATVAASYVMYKHSSQFLESLNGSGTGRAISRVVDQYLDNKNSRRNDNQPPFIEAREDVQGQEEETPTSMRYEGRKVVEEAYEKVAPAQGATPVNDMLEKIILYFGTGDNNQQARFNLRQLKSMIILGLPEGGKTNTSMVLITQLLRQKARLVVIDKEGMSGSGDSLTAKLEPFSSFLECDAGIDAYTAMHAILTLEAIIKERSRDITQATYPVIFVVDEFTLIMRNMKNKDAEWYAVAKRLHALIEELNMRGRKYGIFPMCIGQATNADSTGGTIIRDLFNTRVAHSMRINQAQMLQLGDHKEAISKLEIGQILIDIAQLRNGPIHIKVPYISDTDILKIAKDLRATRNDSVSRPIQKKEQSFMEVWEETNTSQSDEDIINEFMENTEDVYEEEEEASQYPDTEKLRDTENYRMAFRIVGKNETESVSLSRSQSRSSHDVLSTSHHNLPMSHDEHSKNEDIKCLIRSNTNAVERREKEELLNACKVYGEGARTRRTLAHRLGISEHRANILLGKIRDIENEEKCKNG